jgi:hypothetical protein
MKHILMQLFNLRFCDECDKITRFNPIPKRLMTSASDKDAFFGGRPTLCKKCLIEVEKDFESLDK